MKKLGDMIQINSSCFVLILSKVPILPVVISHYSFLDKSAKRMDPANLQIKVLEPIPTLGLGPENVDSLIQETRDKMLETFQNLPELWRAERRIKKL